MKRALLIIALLLVLSALGYWVVTMKKSVNEKFTTIDNVIYAESRELTYREKCKIIIAASEKYPKDSKLSKAYFILTDSIINLSDTLASGLMRSNGPSAFSYFSNDAKAERLFNALMAMCSLSLAATDDSQLKEKINNHFADVITSKDADDWIVKSFRGKSTIESLAAIRQIQTKCLEVSDWIVDDTLRKIKNKK